jgi:hypothetical protein
MVFMLYGVSPLDRATWALAALLMVAAGLVATLVPAARATRADPMVAIRVDCRFINLTLVSPNR